MVNGMTVASERISRTIAKNAFAKPFVKWPGGKNSLSEKIICRFPQKIDSYYEPFVGGGAIYFKIADRLKRAYLSDINPDLIIAYNAIKNDVEKVISRLKTHKKNHCDAYYYDVRDQYNDEIKCSLKVTSQLIYLNKTCYNGLYRVNSEGGFNVPVGRHSSLKICDTDNLRRVCKVLQTADIVIRKFHCIDPEPGAFVYCDPPYHDCFTQYTQNDFTEDDQILLRDKVKEWTKSGVKVMVSNSNTPFIQKIYKGFHFHEVETRRYINCKGGERVKEVELVITNYR